MTLTYIKYQKFEDSPIKLVMGEFEDLLEALEPHSTWDDEKPDGENFLAMAQSYHSIEELTRYALGGEIDQWRDCKKDFLAYIKEIYK